MMTTNNEIFKKTLKEIIDNVDHVKNASYFNNSVTCKFDIKSFDRILKLSLIKSKGYFGSVEKNYINSIEISIINIYKGVIDSVVISFSDVYNILNESRSGCSSPIMFLDEGYTNCYRWRNIEGKPDLSKISEVINAFIKNYI